MAQKPIMQLDTEDPRELKEIIGIVNTTIILLNNIIKAYEPVDAFAQLMDIDETSEVSITREDLQIIFIAKQLIIEAEPIYKGFRAQGEISEEKKANAILFYEKAFRSLESLKLDHYKPNLGKLTACASRIAYLSNQRIERQEWWLRAKKYAALSYTRDSDEENILIVYSIVLQALKEWENALFLSEKAIGKVQEQKFDKTNIPTLGVSSLCALKSGDIDLAFERSQQLISLDSLNTLGLGVLLECYYRKGLYQESYDTSLNQYSLLQNNPNRFKSAYLLCLTILVKAGAQVGAGAEKICEFGILLLQRMKLVDMDAIRIIVNSAYEIRNKEVFELCIQNMPEVRDEEILLKMLNFGLEQKDLNIFKFAFEKLAKQNPQTVIPIIDANIKTMDDVSILYYLMNNYFQINDDRVFDVINRLFNVIGPNPELFQFALNLAKSKGWELNFQFTKP